MRRSGRPAEPMAACFAASTPAPPSCPTARAAVVPNRALRGLSHNPFIAQISLDRPVRGTMERTAATIGALAARQQYGYDGAGIGVALIDSGVASWHEDLAGADGMRVSEFVDFVTGERRP